jgi:hypothetical protein
MGLAVGIPAAIAQTGPDLWSIQLDTGLYAPIEASGPSPTVGMRYCKHYTSHVQGGLLTGWTLKRTSLEAPVTGPLSSESHAEFARVNAHLVPVMGFVQVNLTNRFWLVPFVGIGGGYEWLIVETKDDRTGAKFKTTYDNVAWETFAGIGLRLSSVVRVNGELFYNGGSLERGVLDASGRAFREAVNVSGVGARVGLDMVFE